MNGIKHAILANLLGALLLLSLTSAIAQDYPADMNQDEANPTEPSRPEQDPPGRVARLQFQSGSVSLQPQGTGDWVEGSLNRPLTNSDNIWADKDSKAELNVGTGLLRISNETSLTLTNIGDNNVQVELHQGTLNLHVRRLHEGETYEVDTPNLAFAVQKPGDYRFDVGPGGDGTVINVWKGEGEATGEGPAVPLHAHERAEFNGTSLDHQISEVSAPDSFDEWCQQRDQRLDRSASGRYVSPDVIGSEDLDQNGTWSETPDYGPVWVPSVAPGWAPYHYGHWAWIDPWGWTWVDDASWGFAPFHYGRWVYTGGYWGWAPGPYYVRPFYAPALVAWFGGPAWGVSFGFGFGGGFGWCPLGFGEPFFPWYRGSAFYFRNINIRNTHITNITNITNNFYNHGHSGLSGHQFHYANLHAPGGLTAASQHAISGALPIAKNNVRVSANAAERAQLHGNLPLTPTRTSRLGANAGRPAAAPPTRAMSRPVVSSASSRIGRTQLASLNNRADRPGASTMTGKPSPSTPLRSVPRPPQRAESLSRNTPGTSRPRATQSASTRSVPRPQSGARIAPQERSLSSAGRTDPRSPESGRSGLSRPTVEQRSVARPAGTTSERASNTLPRPTGRVLPASRDAGRDYGSRSASPGSSSRSGGSLSPRSMSPGSRSEGSRPGGYNGAPRSYGQSPRYSAPPSGRGYSAPPSYRGSAPAYHGSAPSYHASAPSGGYSGGGHSGGGYSGGGGGHSAGGGGGGHSGGGHGR
ncbi:MAG TPA: DUF6600 domain-containing protein [Terriglobales bacterium]|nr:DUF6600 domain-containing protein [Terriglobales bacterium]